MSDAAARIRRESAIVFCLNLFARRWGGLAPLPRPTDSPRIETDGPDPDRILVVGSGIITGAGLTSHALGVGGHLARYVSAETGRGVELDVVPIPSLLIRFAPSHLARLDLGRYDALIFAVGVNDIFMGTSRGQWRRSLATILRQVKRGMPEGGRVFLVSIADPTQSPLFRTGPARRALARVRALNLESRQVIGSDPDVTAIGFEIGPVSDRQRLYNSSSYLGWARQLAPRVVESLERTRSRR